jgi:hypothetical protein
MREREVDHDFLDSYTAILPEFPEFDVMPFQKVTTGGLLDCVVVV